MLGFVCVLLNCNGEISNISVMETCFFYSIMNGDSSLYFGY